MVHDNINYQSILICNWKFLAVKFFIRQDWIKSKYDILNGWSIG